MIQDIIYKETIGTYEVMYAHSGDWTYPDFIIVKVPSDTPVIKYNILKHISSYFNDILYISKIIDDTTKYDENFAYVFIRSNQTIPSDDMGTKCIWEHFKFNIDALYSAGVI